MTMKNPPHPGRQIKMILDDCKLSITDAAKHLQVSRKALSEVINGSAGVSASMAVRLNKAFGGTAEIWIRLQAAYDLAQIKTSDIKVKKFKVAVGQN